MNAGLSIIKLESNARRLRAKPGAMVADAAEAFVMIVGGTALMSIDRR